MEVKLENLIEKIKKEGVEEARKEAEGIIHKAKKDASQIIEKAHQEAKNIVDEAQKKTAQFQKNAEAAIKQAARDISLIVKEQIIKFFESLLKRKITHILSPEFMKDLIIKIIEKWSPQETSIEITVNEKDKKMLEELLLMEAKKELKKSIVIKVNNMVESGFRIRIEGEDAYYDFSEESLMEAFKGLLNPTISAILENDNG